MSDNSSTPQDFEIDQQERYARYLLGNKQEILFYLKILASNRSLINAYSDDGQRSFPTLLLQVADGGDAIYLDPPQDARDYNFALSARRMTLIGEQDRVKIQIRLGPVSATQHEGRTALKANMPTTVLRLQRRDYFRLTPSLGNPLYCKVFAAHPDGLPKQFDLRLADLSAGGIGLIAPSESIDCFQRGALLSGCRLDLGTNGILRLDLRVHKAIRLRSHSGQPHLRVGCEFVGINTRDQSVIERFITRTERERKARNKATGV